MFQQPSRLLIGVCLLIFWAVGVSYAQNDSLVVFECKTGEVTFCKVPTPDNQLLKSCSPSFKGDLSQSVNLHNMPPDNPHPNSAFTSLAPASGSFSVGSYPVRTAVKLYYFRQDTIYDLCSGTMVSHNLVLTSGHCLFDIEEEPAWFDSILVLPAFDESSSHPLLGAATAKKLYVFKSYYDNDQWDDIGLIELNESIGQLSGWAGFGYKNDDDFYIDNVFHTFSYPAMPDPDDPSLAYDGNNLFYQRGQLDLLYIDYLGVNVLGIPGQSGSGLMQTDNKSHTIYGVRTFSGTQSFFKINPTVFAGLNHIRESLAEPLSKQEDIANIIDFTVLPSAGKGQWNYMFMAGSEEQVDMQMIDKEGNLLINLELDLQEGVNTGEIDLSEFESENYRVLVRKGYRLLYNNVLQD